MNTFFSLTEIHKAAMHWYGSTDIDSMHKAEMRLWRGDKPRYED
jgi:hypothetical protein